MSRTTITTTTAMSGGTAIGPGGTAPATGMTAARDMTTAGAESREEYPE